MNEIKRNIKNIRSKLKEKKIKTKMKSTNDESLKKATTQRERTYE